MEAGRSVVFCCSSQVQTCASAVSDLYVLGPPAVYICDSTGIRLSNQNHVCFLRNAKPCSNFLEFLYFLFLQ